MTTPWIKKGGEEVVLEIEEDGSVLLSTLKAIFNDNSITGLKLQKTETKWMYLVPKGDKIQPIGGWTSNEYVLCKNDVPETEPKKRSAESDSEVPALAMYVEPLPEDRSGVVITIESDLSPYVFLRLDANGAKDFNRGGVGTVNCQYTAGPYEKFILRAINKNEFIIESLQFPKVFLRMDARHVSNPSYNGSGIVNGQYTARNYERFVLRQVARGVYTIQSAEFPQAYLRMDGSSVKEYSASGSGHVNAQFGSGPMEKFKIQIF